MPEDPELLRRYAEEKSESAFAELVRRRVDFVYSVALRQVGGDAHLAEDVTQKVFVDLARKAAALARRPVLSGWLYRSTQFAASDVVRSERRRRTREQESQAMQDLTTPPGVAADWDKLRPLLDTAMADLSEDDRDAVVLRYFEGRAFAEIGRALRLTEEAARKRVERALDKMAGVLSQRGVTSTSAAVGVALGANALVAAPAGLASAVTTAALGGAAGAGGLAAVVAFMSSTKATIGAGVAAVLAVGAAVYQARVGAERADQLENLAQLHAATQAKLPELERRAQAAEARAAAAEQDAGMLLNAIGSVAARSTATAAEPPPAAATGPITRELVESRYRRAQELARAGNWEAALPELLWCYDEGMVRVSSYTGVRVSFLLSELGKMAKNYPPALAALRERRAAAEQRFMTDATDRGAARDFASINRYLGESGRTLELFDKIPANDPRRASLATGDVYDQLIEARRYNDAAAAQPYSRMMFMFEAATRPVDASNPHAKTLAQTHRRMAIENGGKNIEVLAGAGQLAEARDYAQKLLAFDSSVETRTTLQKHLARAGQPGLLDGLRGP